MELTQQQINTLKYNLRNKYVKIELLNEDLKSVESLEGTAIGGDIKVDANADIRYSGSVSIAIPTYLSGNNFLETAEGYTISAGGKIWLDKRVRISSGIMNLETGEIVWYNLGIYYIDQPVRSFSANEYIITFECADQMVKLSGARQGQLTGTATTIEKDYTTETNELPQLNRNIGGAILNFDTSYTGDFGLGNSTVFDTSDTSNFEVWTYFTRAQQVNIESGPRIIAAGSSDTLTVALGVIFGNPLSYVSLTSSNGTDWEISPIPVGVWSLNVKKIRYWNSQFWAIGNGGLYTSSDNGLNWDFVPLGQTVAYAYSDIAYAFGKYYISIFNDQTSSDLLSQKVLVSSDAMVWTLQDVGERQNWNQLNILGNYLVMTPLTNSNVYIQTTNGTSWTQKTFTATIGTTTYDIYPYTCTSANGYFVCSGRMAQSDLYVLALYTQDMQTWQHAIMRPSSLIAGTRSFLVDAMVFANDCWCMYVRLLNSSRVVLGSTLLTTLNFDTWFAQPISFLYQTFDGGVSVPNKGMLLYSTLSNAYFSKAVTEISFIDNSNGGERTIFCTKQGSDFDWQTTRFTIPSTAGNITAINQALVDEFYSYTAFSLTQYVKVTTQEALQSVISELGGIKNYSIYPIPEKYKYLPYDIKVDVGATVLEILNKFKDILSTWQMYFDRDSGDFIVEPIPSGKNDIIYNIDETQIITNQQNIDFRNVKNQVVVYGRLNTLHNYTDNDTIPESVDYVGNTLKLTYSTLSANTLTIGGSLFGFKTPAEYNPELNTLQLYVNDTLFVQGALVDFEKQKDFVSAETLQPNEIYSIRIFDAFLDEQGEINISQPITFELYSKQQVSYTLVDDNKKSPYYINYNLPNPNFYAGLSKSVDGLHYYLTLNDSERTTTLADKTIITFMANQTNDIGCDFTIYSSFNSTYPIAYYLPLKQNVWNDDGITRPNVPKAKMSNDYTIWKIQYDATNNYFVLLGRNEKAITKILSGGEFDNIWADQLALEMCKWQLFKSSNTQNTISLGIVPNYSLDVNRLIPYREDFAQPQEGRFLDLYSREVGDLPALLVSNDGYSFVVQDSGIVSYITKTLTFPLDVSSTSQSLTAIEVYDSGNLVGDDYSYKN